MEDIQKKEDRCRRKWEKISFPDTKKAGVFSVMMPPPNVTGSLHMGHALTYTLPDILVRYYRAKGKSVLWQPGVDHAGIATQIMVEKEIAKDGLAKQDLGREAFLEKVWAWKKKYGDRIVDQQKRLGLSATWDRHKFTLDDDLSYAVRHAFVTLYKQGLIYKDHRLVHFDTSLKTVLSDLEVVNKETQGFYWTLKYASVENPEKALYVATSRPETLFGDTAVAVHPEDTRYQDWIGHKVYVPLSQGRTIPVIADAYCDPEKGTGVVKITPAHDFNDFEVGKRHTLPMITVLDEDGCLQDPVPTAYIGLQVKEARQKILKDLQDQGLMVSEEKKTLMVPFSERTGVVVEPRLTQQWYCHVKPLAQKALKAGVTFTPERFEKIFNHWMQGIEPWCLSRQLWWGHQIPAWYGPDGHCFVAEDHETATREAQAFYGKRVPLTQDEDVLDTWFSSSLWPMSTLGWPHDTEDLKRYYPTSLLITGSDILFFWVARMIMMGVHFTGKSPFKQVYLHDLVRDEKGQKMSKSKGNVVDPLTVMDRYGTDALRFTLASMATPGRPIAFSESMVVTSGYFVTKIRNILKLCQHYECLEAGNRPLGDVTLAHNTWVLYELESVRQHLEACLENHRFDDASMGLYHFIKGVFCDWYLELAKSFLIQKDPETQETLMFVFKALCRLLHPFMPYVTEDIWEHLSPEDGPLAAKPWIQPFNVKAYQKDQQCMDTMIQLTKFIRRFRNEVGLQPGQLVKVGLEGLSEEHRDMIASQGHVFGPLAKVDSFISHGAALENLKTTSVKDVFKDWGVFIPMDTVDVPSEIQKLEKKKASLEKERKHLEAKLSSQGFLDKAPEDIIKKKRLMLEDLVLKYEKTVSLLKKFETIA